MEVLLYMSTPTQSMPKPNSYNARSSHPVIRPELAYVLKYI